MKKINILPDVVIRENKLNLRTGEQDDEPFSMKRYFNLIIDNHKPFGSTLKKIEQGIRISNSCNEAVKKVVLEEADYAELKEAAEKELHPKVAMACYPYRMAINNAETVETK